MGLASFNRMRRQLAEAAAKAAAQAEQTAQGKLASETDAEAKAEKPRRGRPKGSTSKPKG